MKYKFLFITEFGEINDLIMAVKDAGHEVLSLITDNEWKKIGDGIVDKAENYFDYLGKDYIFVFDGCSSGRLQDWLREKGELVVGGSEEGDELENSRQANQLWFKLLGFEQPDSHNFKDIDEALNFIIENKDKRWILKQNGDAPKSINHMGKFDGNEDMIFHLKELKKGWNEQNFGKFDCDLMEVVDGTEVAASVFFNGNNFLKNKEGLVSGYLNFEDKKFADGNLGPTTGEMGTTFLAVTEKNKVFREIIMNPKIEDYLKKINFHGVFDINGTLQKNGKFIGFEPTCRFGVPATSYEFIEGLKTDPGELLYAMARGEDLAIELNPGIGMVIVIAAPPFPIEVDMDETATSLGEKLWILKDGKPQKDFDDEQKKHIHLYNFEKTIDKETKEECYKVVTKSGYLLTVTGRDGKTLEEVRKNLLEYIKNNIYISDMFYRQKIGERVEKYLK